VLGNAWREVVPLLKVHRILISSGIALCLFYALREGWSTPTFRSLETLLRIALSLLGAAGLGLYLRTLWPR
jgi:hypothetical protein